MATLTTRQWRAFALVLAFVFLVACVGLLRRENIAASVPFHLIDEQEPASNWEDKSQEHPAHDEVHHDATSTTSQSSIATVEPVATTSAKADSNPSEISKAIIMGALESEDTSWVAENMDGWQQAVYRVDMLDNETSPTGFSTKVNKGREAMPYLTYIVDHYDTLPDVMAFVHPHRSGYPQAWHNDAAGYDSVTMLNQLQLAFVVEHGYVNLRCNWVPGCPDEVRPWREPPDLEKGQEHAFPYFYSVFFNRTLEQAKQEVEVVGTPCCAQFAVSRKQVQARPKSEYERIRDLIEATKYDDYTSGRVMEYMWHILFGQEATYCPAMAKCYCDVYGRC